VNWHRYPMLGGLGMSSRAPIPSSRYMSEGGMYTVEPRYAKSRTGRRLKRVVWHLYENRRMIGMPFHSARLAKAFAEALAELGDDRWARAALIRDGAGWCYDKEREWRRERYTQSDA
jgi:hypothetical protein